MSAEVAVRGAVIAALKADAELAGRLHGVFDGAPLRATTPYAVVREVLGAEWGAKLVEGRELRLAIGLHDAGETAGRLGMLMSRVEPVLRAVEAVEGWRIVTLRLLRSRVSRVGARGEAGWQAVMDYRLRVVRE